jgi:hypothetical protein
MMKADNKLSNELGQEKEVYFLLKTVGSEKGKSK